MSKKNTTRIVRVVILLSLLGSGVAQAFSFSFCFMKGNDRRAGFNDQRMPAIGYLPGGYQAYPHSPGGPARYANPYLLPQQVPYDNRYGYGSGMMQY